MAFEKAKLAIEYRGDLRQVYLDIKHLPQKFLLQFWQAVENDPQINAQALKEAINSDYESWLAPYEDEAVNEALSRVRLIGSQAEAEFINVVEVLGSTADLEKLISDLQLKFSDYIPDDFDVDLIKSSLFLKYGVNSIPDLMGLIGFEVVIKDFKYIYSFQGNVFDKYERALYFYYLNNPYEFDEFPEIAGAVEQEGEINPPESLDCKGEHADDIDTVTSAPATAPASDPVPTSIPTPGVGRYLAAWLVWSILCAISINVSSFLAIYIVSPDSYRDMNSLVLVHLAISTLATYLTYLFTYNVIFTTLNQKVVLPYVYVLTALGYLIGLASYWVENAYSLSSFIVISSLASWVLLLILIHRSVYKS